MAQPQHRLSYSRSQVRREPPLEFRRNTNLFRGDSGISTSTPSIIMVVAAFTKFFTFLTFPSYFVLNSSTVIFQIARGILVRSCLCRLVKSLTSSSRRVWNLRHRDSTVDTGQLYFQHDVMELTLKVEVLEDSSLLSFSVWLNPWCSQGAPRRIFSHGEFVGLVVTSLRLALDLGPRSCLSVTNIDAPTTSFLPDILPQTDDFSATIVE